MTRGLHPAPQMEAVAPPPLHPKVPCGSGPGSPPLRGGAVKFPEVNITAWAPPLLRPNTQNTPPNRCGSPLSGGEHTKITEMPPPLRGGARENFRKASKTRDNNIMVAPPKPPKVSPKTVWLPPCQGGVLVAVGSPPRVLG